ncbi:hypothetical protein D3C80_900210 [compost metagenome]
MQRDAVALQRTAVIQRARLRINPAFCRQLAAVINAIAGDRQIASGIDLPLIRQTFAFKTNVTAGIRAVAVVQHQLLAFKREIFTRRQRPGVRRKRSTAG